MPVTERTKLEMMAGAKALAAARGVNVTISPEYMDAVFNTQKRMACIRAWEKEGIITIEKRQEIKAPDMIGVRTMPVTWTIIHVGKHEFEDRDAESKGIFPSELLLANVALCIEATSGDNNGL